MIDLKELRSAADELRKYTTESDRRDIAELLERAAIELEGLRAEMENREITRTS